MTTFGGQILLNDAKGVSEIRSGVITVDDGHIKEIEFGDVPKSVDHGDDQTLLTPGFIDTHLHLPQFDSIGAFGMPLLDWLSEVIFPAEAKWNDLDYAKSMIARVIEQCRSVGTTGVCAYATSSFEATIAALEMFSDAGIRGVIGQAMMDQFSPDSLTVPSDQLIEEVELTLRRFPSTGSMAAAVTPRWALSCTEKTLRAAAGLAKQYGATIQTHLSETTRECELVSKHYDGLSYVDVYDTMGLVTERSVFGHGIYLDKASVTTLSKANSVIAHCPTANSFLGSGTMDRQSHLASGLRISLGSDVGAGYERSMVRVGRSMIEAALSVQFQSSSFQQSGVADFSSVPSAPEAWYQITAGNAEAVRMRDAGRLAIGLPADLLVIQPSVPWLTTSCPLSTVMFSWDDRWLKQTLLGGQVVWQ
ncbi:amidohydrolase family protein [Stieleria sp. JC731]|uniref:amidohydrolase family protein n=1 Tax=Pirellulaceae TaxID=2691357 RepID=UPI001E3BC598|nr:amidohydrolase family protein [Stieleria sp. JC731]MCC9602771.1 amidohydrolase family protein [Stieleria sp. JC731]